MKRSFKGLFVFAIMVISFFGITKVDALTMAEYGGLDTDRKISMPYMVFTSGTKVTVSNDITNYKLYHQWIKISDSDSKKMNELADEMDAIKDEMKSYSDSATDEEKLTEEYRNKVKKYEEDYNKLLEQRVTLIPMYNGDKWEVAKDDKVYLPGNNGYFLWVKLVEADNTESFDVNIYMSSSSSSSSSSNTSVDTNKDYDTNDKQTSDSSKTVHTSENPGTGISEYVVGLVVLSMVIGLVLVYVKTKESY